MRCMCIPPLLGHAGGASLEMQLQPPARAQLVRLPPTSGPRLDLRRWFQDALLLIPDQFLLSELSASFVLLRDEAKDSFTLVTRTLSCSIKP